MVSNRVCCISINISNQVTVSNEAKRKSWPERVQHLMEKEALFNVTCKIYSQSDKESPESENVCPCGRKIRSHSFAGPDSDKASEKDSFDEADSLDASNSLNAYGEFQMIGPGSGLKYLRCYSGEPTVFGTLAKLVIEDIGMNPDLIVSCFGGAENFVMTDKLEKEFVDGISQVAGTKGVWLLTTGLNKGVSELIGQCAHRFTLLNESEIKPTIIGINSWGALAEITQDILKKQSSSNKETLESKTPGKQEQKKYSSWNENIKLNKYHSHCLLLDNGRTGEYLDDRPRLCFVNAIRQKTQCHALTIIIEGGFNTLQVIRHELEENRPVVIIHGSGRLANVLGTLLEDLKQKNSLQDNEVKNLIEKYFPNDQQRRERINLEDFATAIKDILTKENLKYLSIFKLEQDASLTETIFKAVDDVQKNANDDKQRFLKLAISWNYIQRAKATTERPEDDRKFYPELFKQALLENRPVFVDYFLRRDYYPFNINNYIKDITKKSSDNALTNNEIINQLLQAAQIKHDEAQIMFAVNFLIEELYHGINKIIEHWHRPTSLTELDEHNIHLIGPYAKSFYFQRNIFHRMFLDIKLLDFHRWTEVGTRSSDQTPSTTSNKIDSERMRNAYYPKKYFDSQTFLRDMFLWSVYAGYSDIAFVLLLRMESRIGLSLLAASIARRLSLKADHLESRIAFEQQANQYEEYATSCITACYKHNQERACELVLHENSILGDTTYMQIAIFSNSLPFINTTCFNEVLNREWVGQLSSNTFVSLKSKISFWICLLLFGIPAPFMMKYRQINYNRIKIQDPVTSNESARKRSRQWKGIETDRKENPNYLDKLLYFHSAPAVKMSYHFAIYIWFLLVFSYMMLFEMKFEQKKLHWSKIYLIISVSSMLLDDFRQILTDYYTRMLETVYWSALTMILIYIIPYILFYIGIICAFKAGDNRDSFTTARIILAIDLELWYLFSLRFVSAIKLLGPKLVMIRNMLRDLTAFMYIIFVCIAAYGVVSRALVAYSNIDFSAKSIFTEIFYHPYWFLYSIVDSEKTNLDNIISNSTDPGEVSEATVNHVLLAFHMLFINILILNLLIAVFNYTINDVQEKSESVWRYQRYELIREYFQKQIFAYPPLSLIVYLPWLINLLFFRGTTVRIFKHLRNEDQMRDYWTEFENAATYEHARNFVENHYRAKDEITISTLQTEVNLLKSENKQIRSDTEKINEKVSVGMGSMIKAMHRVKMLRELPPGFHEEKSSEA